MQAFFDHYRTLQVHHEASQEVIEAAWKRLSRIYHPDVNPRTGEKMKEINRAYDVLRESASRAAYHREWLRCTSGFSARVGQQRQQPAAPAREAQEQAQQALDGYFRCLMDCRWESAYLMLTAADRKNVPQCDFADWKNAVAQCWRVGSYAIKPFRKHLNCTVSGAFYREVYEFSVFICDMDARTGRVSEENYLKYVARDAGVWRVCLGYSDVKPLTLRFRYMADNADLLDPAQVWAEAVMSRDRQTGLLSRSGFTEKAEAEAVRSRRYGNPFTVALLSVRPAEAPGAFSAGEYESMCVIHAARAIGPCIRQTDLFGRWSPVELALLFTETPRDNGGFAMEKILNKLNEPKDLDYSVVFGIAEFDGLQFEDTMAAAASDAQVRRSTNGGVTETVITMTGGL